MSTLAPTTCASVGLPAALRMIALRRGSTAWIVPVPSSTRAESATQSPAAGSSPGPASWRSFPEISAFSSPSSVRTR